MVRACLTRRKNKTFKNLLKDDSVAKADLGLNEDNNKDVESLQEKSLGPVCKKHAKRIEIRTHTHV